MGVEFVEDRFDLPALGVERAEFGGGSDRRVEQVGDQPVEGAVCGGAALTSFVPDPANTSRVRFVSYRRPGDLSHPL